MLKHDREAYPLGNSLFNKSILKNNSSCDNWGLYNISVEPFVFAT